MKVKQYIRYLQKLPPDALILQYDAREGYHTAFLPKLAYAIKDKKWVFKKGGKPQYEIIGKPTGMQINDNGLINVCLLD